MDCTNYELMKTFRGKQKDSRQCVGVIHLLLCGLRAGVQGLQVEELWSLDEEQLEQLKLVAPLFCANTCVKSRCPQAILLV